MNRLLLGSIFFSLIACGCVRDEKPPETGAGATGAGSSAPVAKKGPNDRLNSRSTAEGA